MAFPEGLIVRHADCIEVRNRNILDAMAFPEGLIVRHAECIEVRIESKRNSKRRCYQVAIHCCLSISSLVTGNKYIGNLPKIRQIFR